MKKTNKRYSLRDSKGRFEDKWQWYAYRIIGWTIVILLITLTAWSFLVTAQKNFSRYCLINQYNQDINCLFSEYY